MADSSVRYVFDSITPAAQALIEVMQYARKNADSNFRFGGLTAAQILASGLWIDAAPEPLIATLDKIPGALRSE